MTTFAPYAVLDTDADCYGPGESIDADLRLPVIGWGLDDTDGTARPIVTAAAFETWIAARAANDRNGTWAAQIDVDGDDLTYLSDEYRGIEEPLRYARVPGIATTDGTPGYLLDGFAPFVRYTA